MRGKTISYSTYKVKEERAKESELESKINKLTDHLVYCQHTGAPEIIIDSLERDLNFFQKELEKICYKQVNASIMRSHIQYSEEGENHQNFS